MRQIKFRGRDVITGQWAYGYYYPSKGNHIIRDENDNETIVLEKTVGQFSGLKGKRNIYEGDIVKYESHTCNKIIAEVRFGFNDDESSLFISGLMFSPIHVEEEFKNRESHGMIKIGNIYENPELLK